MMHLRCGFLIVFLYLTSEAFATVGGPEFLKFIGQQNDRLYFIYEYYNEGSDPPELWYYDISKDSLIVSTNWIDYPSETIQEALRRNKLFNMSTADTTHLRHDIDFTFLESERIISPSMGEAYDIYRVLVLWNDESYLLRQCFHEDPEPQVVDIFTLREPALSFAIIRYEGVCVETGYMRDTLLIQNAELPEIIQVTEKKKEPVGEIKADKDAMYLVYVLVIISAGMMLYIFIRRS